MAEKGGRIHRCDMRQFVWREREKERGRMRVMELSGQRMMMIGRLGHGGVRGG